MYKIDKKLYLFGFSRWKHTFVKVFLKEYDKKNIFFINPLFLSHLDLAKKRGLCSGCDIFIWGKKEFGKVEAFGKSYVRGRAELKDDRQKDQEKTDHDDYFWGGLNEKGLVEFKFFPIKKPSKRIKHTPERGNQKSMQAGVSK